MNTLFQSIVFAKLQSPSEKAAPNSASKVCTEMSLTISDFVGENSIRKSWPVVSVWDLVQCLIILNSFGKLKISFIRLFVLYFQMLCCMSEVIWNFTQQEMQNNWAGVGEGWLCWGFGFVLFLFPLFRGDTRNFYMALME